MSSNSSSSNGKGKNVKTKGDNEEEQLEVPKELDYLFEKELINKQNKHIHIKDEFGPSRTICHLPSKFYARHEQSVPNYAAYMPFVEGSAYKYDTTNNVYGWMPDSVKSPALLRELNFINAPKQRCCLTVYGEKLESDKANERPVFNGLRFYLH